MEITLNNNFSTIENSNLSLINGGANAWKLVGGAVGLVIVAPIAGALAGPVAFAGAYVTGVTTLFSGL